MLLFNIQIRLLALITLNILLTQAAAESVACFQDPYSQECSDLIRSRYYLTLEGFASVRTRIKLLADADRFRVSSDGHFTAFEMGMGCYAIGQQVPSDNGCASCLHCTAQLNPEVCDLFCPPVTETQLPPAQLSPSPEPLVRPLPAQSSPRPPREKIH